MFGVVAGMWFWTAVVAMEEFDRLLDELAEGPTLPHLPADFSRADVYADHD